MISLCNWSRVSIRQIRICFNQASEKAYVPNDSVFVSELLVQKEMGDCE